VNVHKLLFGEGAATYLPFALARLRALESISPNGFLSQTFIVDDATIKVWQVGRQKYITITVGGGFYFEFLTSGKPVTSVVKPGYGEIYNPLVVATDVSAKDGSIVIKPYVRNNGRGLYNSRVGYQTQVQLVNEKPRYKQLGATLRAAYKFPYVVYGSFSPGHPFTGLGARGTMLQYQTVAIAHQLGMQEAHTVRDYGYDYSWGYGTGLAVQSNAYLNTTADWPRESSHQTVVSEQWGTRSFGIIADAFGRFHVFPVASISGTSTTENVTNGHVRSLYPTYPSWAYIPTQRAKDYWSATPTVFKWCVDQPDIEWNFNHTGTKAVALICGRSEFKNDTAYWTSGADANTPWTQTHFDDTLQPYMNTTAMSQNAPLDGYQTFKPTRYFWGAGIVEIEIQITLTGANPNDYTAEIIANTVRDPNTNLYSALAVGYSYVDLSGKGIAAGDMLALDIEAYTAFSVASNTFELLSIKNITKSTEPFCTLAHPVLGIDLSTVSLALRVTKQSMDTIVSTPMRGSPSTRNMNWTIEHFAVGIVHGAGFVELIYPDTMEEAKKIELQAVAAIDGRAYYADKIANKGSDTIEQMPLGHPYDGWGTNTNYDAWRTLIAHSQLYWYNESWVLRDPNVWYHGSTYPTDGWVRYKDPTSTGFTGYTGSVPVNEIPLMESPPLSAALHLALCDNPRWGWHYYQGVFQKYFMVSPWTTFFTHPNGSYAFYSDAFFYNTQGMMETSQASPTVAYVEYGKPLDIFDETKIEHCIFDRVLLQVKGKTGQAASLATSFRELYNQAVTNGITAQTLEDGIFTLERAEMKGVLKKETALYPCATGEYHHILDLKFTWNNRSLWFPEQGMKGDYTTTPGLAFDLGPSGNLIGLNLMLAWNKEPYNEAGNNTVFPQYVDWSSPAAWPIRFANPIIVMGE
jgi:hypothetical protein